MRKHKINRSAFADELINNQIIWYANNVDDPRIAHRFVDAVEQAIEDIAQYARFIR